MADETNSTPAADGSNQYDFGELTKAMIVNNLKGAGNAEQVASEISRKTMIAGVQSTRAKGQQPEATVAQISYGAMSGLLIIEKDVVKGATEILRGTADIAGELSLDPSSFMTWAMDGIAKMASLSTQDVRFKIREGIEAEFMGAGEVFDQLCEKYLPKR